MSFHFFSLFRFWHKNQRIIRFLRANACRVVCLSGRRSDAVGARVNRIYAQSLAVFFCGNVWIRRSLGPVWTWNIFFWATSTTMRDVPTVLFQFIGHIRDMFPCFLVPQSTTICCRCFDFFSRCRLSRRHSCLGSHDAGLDRNVSIGRRRCSMSNGRDSGSIMSSWYVLFRGHECVVITIIGVRPHHFVKSILSLKFQIRRAERQIIHQTMPTGVGITQGVVDAVGKSIVTLRIR